jgi:hypothetical protein
MAIQYNDITAIGDVFEVQTNTPIIGIQSISGYTDEVLNETVGRFFNREFRYSLNGITYSDWIELTNQNLIDTFVGQTSIFDIQYRYTRAGTDTTGFLTFVSVQLEGVVEEVENPRIFTDLYFNKFFNYNDSEVLGWALNVLDKLYQRGIVANYMQRNEPGVNDDDYIAFFGALTHFMAILVRYAREFRDFTLSDILLNEYLKQKGTFVNDGMTLSDLQTLLENLYVNFFERGTNEITKELGINGRVIDGELLRLLRKGSFDEFIWGLIEPEKTIWNINNNSPIYKGTKQAVNLIKAYEFTQDLEDLNNYPLVEPSFVSAFTDGSLETVRVLNSTSSNVSGIGDALTNDKLILIDSRLSYEVTFYVKQVVLSNSFSLKVFLYDEGENLLLDSPLDATTGTQTNISIDKQQLLKNDQYYFVRLILFNENISTDPANTLDIGLGNHLIINNSDTKFMSVDVGTEINDGNNDLRIWDFKVRPLMSPISNGFVMVPNVITSFLENNSEENNLSVQNKVKRYLIPYNSILKNQFLDELYVPSGTPLRISILDFTNETVLGANNGTITIVAAGGKAPYAYSINNGVDFFTIGEFTNLSPATYNIVVEDADGVQVTDTVIIQEGVTNLSLQAFATSSSRLDVANGQIEIIASGGVSPYFYSIDGISWSVNGVFTGLLAASYTAYVRDTDTNQVSTPIVVDTLRGRTIVFTIVDENASPVQNVNISVIGENYLTNSSGQATIYLADGQYSFILTKPGYRRIDIINAVISSDRNFNETIQTYYSLTFVVNDSVGAGLTNALIQSTSTPATQLGFATSTPSNSNTITVPNLIAGNYSFVTSRAEYNDQNSSINLTTNDTLNIVMAETLYQVAVNVKSSSPPSTVVNESGATVRVGSLSQLTNSSGNITFNLVAGSYSFQASQPGFETITLPATLPPPVSLDFVLRKVIDVRILITGIPSPYFAVRVELTGPQSLDSGSGTSSVLTFNDIIAGTYDVKITGGYFPGGLGGSSVTIDVEYLNQNLYNSGDYSFSI